MGGSPAKSSSESYNPYSQQFGQAVQQYQGANTQGLTPAEQEQLDLINQGRQAGQEQIRSEATNRGMFSSAGALGQEGLLEQQLAGQKADIYGNAQQRYMGGLQNVAQLYGSQQKTSSSQTGESGGFLGGVGGLVGAGVGSFFGPGGAKIGYQLGSGGGKLGGK